jgi:hypothetical protein
MVVAAGKAGPRTSMLYPCTCLRIDQRAQFPPQKNRMLSASILLDLVVVQNDNLGGQPIFLKIMVNSACGGLRARGGGKKE